LRIEIRNDSVIISGYVNATERNSRVMASPHGKFIEQVKSKVFQRALDNSSNIDILLNHNSSKKLGSTSEGNLKLCEDNIGLRAMATITDAETMQKAKDNKLIGWSFAFSANKDSWEDAKDGIQRRFLEDIDLKEVSILDNTKICAYEGTSIESRDEKSILIENRSFEDAGELVDCSTKDTKKDIELREANENLKKQLLIECEL